ncbi:atrial natriuretic peptide receptor 1-like [Littorina saxatilis]|uniref:atrial natriuretic peptide receptor 1-like n=1 Tax=Littorina saxatilis TaxID=31220 RepID=UPI0038B4CBD3
MVSLITQRKTIICTWKTRVIKSTQLSTSVSIYLSVLATVLVSPSLGQTHNFTIGVFLPQSGEQRVGAETEAAVNWTIRRLNSEFGNQFKFRYVMKDTQCDTDEAVTQFVDTMCDQADTMAKIHVVIGPVCDEVCEVLGGLAGKRDVPVISHGCGGLHLPDSEEYPTFLRTSGAFIEMERFLEELFWKFGWSRITVVHGNGDVWVEISDEFEDTLKHSGFQVRQLSIRHPETLEDDLRNESQKTRVFLICGYSKDIVRFMEMASQLGLTGGEYAFFTIDFANGAKILSNWTHNPALDGLLDITVDVSPDSTEYREFIRDIFAAAGYTQPEACPSSYELGIHAALLSDAILLYAASVNATVSEQGNPKDSALLLSHLYDAAVDGVSGKVAINQEGSRTAQFMLHNIQTGCYVSIATYNHKSKVTFLNHSIIWPGGSRAFPDGSPACGWDGERCATEVQQTVIIIGTTCSIVAVAFAMVAFVAFKFIKRRETARKLQSTDWKISFKRLKKPRNVDGLCMLNGNLRGDDGHFGSTVSIESTDSLKSTVQRTEGLYYYNGQVVIVKQVAKTLGVGVPETAKLCRELNQIRQLDHRNINPFIGACTEKERLCLVNSYCRKGSLFDVLHKSDLNFDCRFVASFSTDISKGLHYIHTSEVGYHGRLKSRNVFVDNTFTCKIGDFHMDTFREGEIISPTWEYFRTRQLWSAPEVLTGQIYRQERTTDKTLLWQRADMWSFGVILHEIINREKPFPSLFDSDPERAEKKLQDSCRPDENSLEHLLQEIQTRKSHCTNNDQYVVKVIDLIGLCWQTFAEMRLTSGEVAKRLREYAKEHNLLSSNLYENLIHMMTKNEDELNRQVQLRTELLENEKNKTQNLLYQMMPVTVAKQLIQGKSPKAEFYECVTIFFSDIVGFTQLSATCSPMEVMDIVNHLYLCFDNVIESYNVYKVETIGDAYMVASGLPERNGDEHAEAIADMALDLLSIMHSFEVPHKPDYRLKVRSGIHSGPVMAGVVGSKMPRYCVFGDTVNTASRMESHGKALQIHISEKTKQLLDKAGTFHMTRRADQVDVKGKGRMPTYWLTGKNGFNKALPPIQPVIRRQDSVNFIGMRPHMSVESLGSLHQSYEDAPGIFQRSSQESTDSLQQVSRGSKSSCQLVVEEGEETIVCPLASQESAADLQDNVGERPVVFQSTSFDSTDGGSQNNTASENLRHVSRSASQDVLQSATVGRIGSFQQAEPGAMGNEVGMARRGSYVPCIAHSTGIQLQVLAETSAKCAGESRKDEQNPADKTTATQCEYLHSKGIESTSGKGQRVTEKEDTWKHEPPGKNQSTPEKEQSSPKDERVTSPNKPRCSPQRDKQKAFHNHQWTSLNKYSEPGNQENTPQSKKKASIC